MSRLSKPAFQHIESEIFRYHETKKEVNRLRQEIMYGKPFDENIGGGRSNLPGDPTGNIATAVVTNRKLQNMERFVHAIETVYEQSTDEHKRLIRLKYWTKPQTRTWEGIAQELNVGRMTAFRWRKEIVYAIAELLGLW